MSAAGGVDKAAERAIEMGADAVQLFVQSPRLWRPQKISDETVERFKQLRVEGGLQAAVTHAIYLINIASQDDELFAKSNLTLRTTMETSERLGLEAVIFHPGSHKGAGLDAVMDRLVEGITNTLEASETTWLLLENCAGAGGTIGRSVEELAEIFERVGHHPRLGVCVDTCHWFVSGTDIRARETLDGQLDLIDSTFGLDRLRCLHLNDSKAELGSNRDRHENIGDGLIGDGLATILGHPKLQHLPAILEVPGDGDGPTIEQLARIRALHASAIS